MAGKPDMSLNFIRFFTAELNNRKKDNATENNTREIFLILMSRSPLSSMKTLLLFRLSTIASNYFEKYNN